jgi:transketolase
MVYQALIAAEELSRSRIKAEVINCATVKPLDHLTILASVRKTRAVITVEEAQAAGGLGGAVAELLGEHEPLPLMRVGMHDRFGESGEPTELLEHFELTGPHIARFAHTFVNARRKG